MPYSSITSRINRPGIERDITILFDQSQYSQAHMFEQIGKVGMYEPETVHALDLLLEPGDGFIDIGAHIGFFSLIAAGFVGPKGRVYSFEPQRQNYEQLLRQIQLNKLTNITPFPWAVSDKQEVLDLNENLDNDGGHALWNVAAHPFNEKTRNNITRTPVFSIRLDVLFQGARPGFVKLIKIDAEGSEVAILHGSRNFLKRANVPAVIAEVNDFALRQMGASEQAMRSVMEEDLGYACFLLQGDTPTKVQPGAPAADPIHVYNLLFVNRELDQKLGALWETGNRHK